MISPAQCRAARGLIDWPASKLSRRSGVKTYDIRQFERGSTKLRERENAAVRSVLEDAGIEFIDGNGGGAGVRFRAPNNDAQTSQMSS
ncbi:hypothetical protein M673_23497 (plasmid) [Aureimonas sp. AU20]|nr:hypothetical protein M673_23497 [Aureimonas sp. AU20]